MTERGPDGHGLWVGEHLALGHRRLATTPEAAFERQPLSSADGDLCLTLDGRLDNREELKAELTSLGSRLRSDTDAEIVLEAYRHWGEQSPARILGDFAFAVWDANERRLFCARDPLGLKPFYYHLDGRIFLFASELRALLRSPAVPREINEGMIGEYLSVAIASQEETLFRGIQRLPPAHALTVGPRSFRKRRYWSPDPDNELRLKDEDEYAARFLEILSEAVRCRMRSGATLGAHLSGGLDSSSVVCMAESLRRAATAPCSGLEAFSLTFDGWACDESPYIEDVVGATGVSIQRLDGTKPGPARYEEEARRYADLPSFPNAIFFDALQRRARERGVRALLTGIGGDQWLAGSLWHHADLIRSFEISQALRQARQDARALAQLGEHVSAAYLILRHGVAPLLPGPVKRMARWFAGRGSHVPSWIDPTFARRIALADRLRKRPQLSGRRPGLVWLNLAGYLVSGWSSLWSELTERRAAAWGLEERHPFLDRRLVELCLSLPEDQRWRGVETKFVLRQAMRGLLPERVRGRLTKADFSQVVPKTLASVGGAGALLGSSVVAAGWVSAERTEEMYRRMRHFYERNDEGYWTLTWPLWMIYAVGVWYSTFTAQEDAWRADRTKTDPALRPEPSIPRRRSVTSHPVSWNTVRWPS